MGIRRGGIKEVVVDGETGGSFPLSRRALKTPSPRILSASPGILQMPSMICSHRLHLQGHGRFVPQAGEGTLQLEIHCQADP